MKDHFPDNWIILKTPTAKSFLHKILAGWNDSSSSKTPWLLTGNIKDIKLIDGTYQVTDVIGMTYYCDQNSEKVTPVMNADHFLVDLNCEVISMAEYLSNIYFKNQ
jgi:hypothetical protein|tara:strand:+ start:194 stop:511 length:318 start_codon:yes stop_codon:yes gene_type:complete